MKERYDDDEDDYRKRAALDKKEKLAKGIFKLPEGETTFRLLETPRDKERGSRRGYMENYVHWGVGPKGRTLTCGLKPPDDSGDCWLCRKLEKEKEKGNTAIYEANERKGQLLVQVAPWDDDIGGLTGPLMWSIPTGRTSKSLNYKILSILSSEKDYLNPKTGYNFTIDRTGTGFKNTNYGAPVRAEEPSAVPKAILKKLKPFVDVVPPYDPDEQKKAYYGTPDTSDEEEPANRPKRKFRLEDEEDTRVAKKSRFDEDEDDEPKKKKKVIEDEEDEDLQYGEDEDEKPKKKSRFDEEEDDEPPVKKKKRPVEDEEEDDEDERPKKRKVVDDDDDLEEDDRPPKKRAREDDDDDLEDDEPKPKKKRVVEEEEEDDVPPPKKRKVVIEEEEEDDEPVKPKKRKVVEEEDEDDEPVRTKKKVRREED